MDARDTKREMWRSAIIEPPGKASEMPLERVRLVVCSEDRDVAIFPSPSRYDVDLPEEFNNVHSVELSTSMFRFSAYQINVYNNQLRITLPDPTADDPSHRRIAMAALPIRNYASGTDLAAAVEAGLNAAMAAAGVAGAPPFVVAYDPTYEKFMFTCATAFAFDFRNPAGQCHSVLGFGATSYTPTQVMGQWAMTGAFRADLDHYNRFVVLRADAIDSLLATHNPLSRSFAILTRTKLEAGQDDATAVHEFLPPVTKLNRLRVTVVDRFGNQYPAENVDHVFELRLKHLQYARKNW